MKTKLSTAVFLILSLVIVNLTLSCGNFGTYMLLFGEDNVDDRVGKNGITQLGSITVGENQNQAYSFICISDVHFGSKKAAFPYQSFFNSFDELLESSDSTVVPRFLVCLGDCADGGSESQYNEYNNFLNQVKTHAKEIIAPDDDSYNFNCYSVLGNHDLYNNGWYNYKKKVYPYSSYYTFQVNPECENSFKFYIIDTANSTLGNYQFNSFIKVLREDTNPKLVFSHYPITGDEAFIFKMQNTMERNIMLSTMVEHNVKGFFAGHVHTDEEHYFSKFTEVLVPSTRYRKGFRLITVNPVTNSVTSQIYWF